MAKAKAVKRREHSREAVAAHILKHHPNCPPEIASVLVERIAERVWHSPVKLGTGFGIVSTAYVRHNLTDYDWWLRVVGLKQEEARVIVAPVVTEIISSWGPAPKGKVAEAGSAASRER